MTPDVASRLPALMPKIIAWAEAEEQRVLALGEPLTIHGLALARSVGVQHPEKIRIHVTEELPLPDHPEIRMMAFQTDLFGPTMRAFTLGYGLSIRFAHRSSARLLSHELRHVHQYEMLGSIRQFLPVYLGEILQYGYERAPLEIDARAHEVGNE